MLNALKQNRIAAVILNFDVRDSGRLFVGLAVALRCFERRFWMQPTMHDYPTQLIAGGRCLSRTPEQEATRLKTTALFLPQPVFTSLAGRR